VNRFEQRMSDEKAREDTRLLGDFTGIYCRGVHKGSERSALVSDGSELGVYGSKVPIVCPECAELLRYAEKRRAFCPKDPKPFCSYCDTHCYSAEMRDRMREVMRYSGPRSLLRGHAVDGIKHLIEGRKARAAAAKRAGGLNEKGSER
jgi:hypothetical protein